jgi:hypothetical protein
MASDLQVNEQEEFSTWYNAAPYLQACKVYAPVYRQMTVYGLSQLDGRQAVMQQAYTDIATAFQEYVATNPRRKFMLVGHSQGAMHLSKLLKEVVEKDKKMYARFIGAHLLGGGGSTAMPVGGGVGVSFEKTPMCTNASQVQCVVGGGVYKQNPGLSAKATQHLVRPSSVNYPYFAMAGDELGVTTMCTDFMYPSYDHPIGYFPHRNALPTWFAYHLRPSPTCTTAQVFGLGDQTCDDGIDTSFFTIEQGAYDLSCQQYPYDASTWTPLKGNCTKDTPCASYLGLSASGSRAYLDTALKEGSQTYLFGNTAPDTSGMNWGMHALDFAVASGTLAQLAASQAMVRMDSCFPIDFETDAGFRFYIDPDTPRDGENSFLKVRSVDAARSGTFGMRLTRNNFSHTERAFQFEMHTGNLLGEYKVTFWLRSLNCSSACPKHDGNNQCSNDPDEQDDLRWVVQSQCRILVAKKSKTNKHISGKRIEATKNWTRHTLTWSVPNTKVSKDVGCDASDPSTWETKCTVYPGMSLSSQLTFFAGPFVGQLDIDDVCVTPHPPFKLTELSPTVQVPAPPKLVMPAASDKAKSVQRRQVEKSKTWPRECDAYMEETGCDWTDEYACPGGKKRDDQVYANDDGSLGFNCCCDPSALGDAAL